jgi:hypothetical protein
MFQPYVLVLPTLVGTKFPWRTLAPISPLMEKKMEMSPKYESKYNEYVKIIPFVAQAVSESAGTVNSVAANSGEEGVQALFDSLMDAGHRMVLVQALNSPSISGWVREKLTVFLYGQSRQTPALFSHLH